MTVNCVPGVGNPSDDTCHSLLPSTAKVTSTGILSQTVVEEPPLGSLSGQCKAERAPNGPKCCLWIGLRRFRLAAEHWSPIWALCVPPTYPSMYDEHVLQDLPTSKWYRTHTTCISAHKASSRLVCGQIRSPTGFVPSSVAVVNVWDPGGGGGRSHLHEASRDWFLAGVRVRDSKNPKTLDDVDGEAPAGYQSITLKRPVGRPGIKDSQSTAILGREHADVTFVEKTGDGIPDAWLRIC
ncbi:uncharacterized protein CLUP02_09195 [Colletotrichum lupini]|uniref:Uncharacterized protein n=1 Tax=Colletotrichum lupini TaxID=145971 RepID=A0A9Q8SU81_9PEZI|nr:uncharacterized protein CLUP02_09195 [Colletotrichum lupini]UQC83699.1 hypothetical protein CLUP02_09195 [Colletotrichum lupini]